MTEDIKLELIDQLVEIAHELNELDNELHIDESFNERFNLLAHKLALRYLKQNIDVLDFMAEEYKQLFAEYVKQGVKKEEERDEQE